VKIEEIRWDNLTKLLDFLYAGKHVLRKELTEKMKIRNSTLSYLLSELTKLEMVKIEKIVGGRGRPNHVISLNPAHGTVFGVKLGRESLRAIVFDFSLKKIDSVEYPLHEIGKSIPGVMNELKKVVERYKPVGAGFAVSGTVDLKSKRIIKSPILNLRNFDFGPFISEMSLPEFVMCNDVDALHIGQIVESGIINKASLTISFGVGIGASYYDGQDLFVGSDGKTAFEFGHHGVDPDGEKCYCGRIGCLETVASEYVLVKEKAGNIANFVANFDLFRPVINEFRERAKKERLREYEGIIKSLSYYLSNLVLSLRPTILWIGGEGIVSEWIFNDIVRSIKFNLEDGWEIKPEIMRITDPESWEKGAAFLLLRKYISSKIKVGAKG